MNILRIPHPTTLALTTALLLSIGSTVFAQEKKAARKPVPTIKKPKADSRSVGHTEKAKAKEARATASTPASSGKTHTVRSGKFEVVLELSGIVGAASSTPISVSPKVWTDLTVVRARANGSPVKKGDVILQLETEKLKKTIRDKKDSLPLAELTLKTAERELELAEKTNPMDLEKGRRSTMEAEENLAYYEDIEMPMQIRNEKETVKSAKDYLEYAEEELKQLKKMYENDDVTEETEEIVLRRAQNNVDKYKWSLERAKIRMDRSLGTTIPRDHDNRIRNLRRQQISWRTGEQSLREGLEKKRLETEQAHRNYKKTLQDLDDLERDLKLMSVRAPRDGIVYLGISQRGRWVTASTLERKLVPGGKVTPKEIVMTIVSPENLLLHVPVPENKLKDLAVGQKGAATLKWNSDIKLDAVVRSLSHVPNSSQSYDAVFNLTRRGEGDSPVYPGMNVVVKIKVFEKENALTVPKAAVKKEGEKYFVTLKGGKKREVETGRSDNTSTEILSGIKAGEVVEVPTVLPSVKSKTPTAAKAGK